MIVDIFGHNFCKAFFVTFRDSYFLNFDCRLMRNQVRFPANPKIIEKKVRNIGSMHESSANNNIGTDNKAFDISC